MRAVLVYSGTGGGHEKTARAVADELELRKVEVKMVDGLKYLPWPFSQSARIYKSAIGVDERLNVVGYQLLNNQAAYKLAELLGWATKAKINSFFRENPAEAYVVCQPHFNPFMAPYLKKYLPERKYIHVVTDLLACHRFHFVSQADVVCVASEIVAGEAAKNGVDPKNIYVTGIPVRKEFRPRRQRRYSHEPRVLLMGGAIGSNKAWEVCRLISKSRLELRLTVVCGWNRQLAKKATELNDKRIEVLGFYEQIAELMQDSEVVLTKAGGLTLSEGFAMGRAMMIYDAIPGQETGNVKYAVDSGAGLWVPESEKVVEKLAELLENPGEIEKLAKCAEKLGQPDAALKVAKLVCGE